MKVTAATMRQKRDIILSWRGKQGERSSLLATSGMSGDVEGLYHIFYSWGNLRIDYLVEGVRLIVILGMLRYVMFILTFMYHLKCNSMIIFECLQCQQVMKTKNDDLFD
mgnify:CR=1 FL=1